MSARRISSLLRRWRLQADASTGWRKRRSKPAGWRSIIRNASILSTRRSRRTCAANTGSAMLRATTPIRKARIGSRSGPPGRKCGSDFNRSRAAARELHRQPQAELNDARRVGDGRDLAEVRIRNREVRHAEAHEVEDVQGV